MRIEDRRRFLTKGFTAGAVTLAMPSVATLKLLTFHGAEVSGFSYAGGDRPVLDFTLDELLARHGSQFAAEASARGVFAGIARILPIAAAALTIMQWFGIRSPFSKRPSYVNARQCTDCYRNAQSDLMSRGVNYFSDIARPASADNVSAMLGSTTPSPDDTVQVTTQGGTVRAVPLTEREPGVLAATLEGLREKYPGDERYAPLALTAIDKRLTPVDGSVGMRYETPIHTVVYDSRVRGNYNGGILYFHRKADRRNPENQYWMGLYA